MRAITNVFRAREMPVFLALVLVVAIAGIANPAFLSAAGAIDILLGVAIVAILAVGQTFVIVMRHIDLSVGSLIGFTSFLIGDLYAQGYGLWGGLAAALGVGLIVGAANGFLVAYLKLPSLVVTLGALYIVRGVFNDYAFGRTITAAMVPPEVAWIGLNRLGGIPYLFLIGLALVIVSGLVMRRVKAARDLYAIGSNPAAAELAGIPVARRVFGAFVLNGAITGLAGAVMLGRFNAANANSGLALELIVIAACVVGGVTIAGGSGSVWGLSSAPSCSRPLPAPLVRWVSHSSGSRPSTEDSSSWRSLSISTSTAGGRRRRLWGHKMIRWNLTWDKGVGLFLIFAVLLGSLLSDNFANASNLSFVLRDVTEFAIIALAMTFLIISGEIDLSVASTLNLSSASLAFYIGQGCPLRSRLSVDFSSDSRGLFNGWLVTKLGLPSLAVTIATLALYRGLSYALLGNQPVNELPEFWIGIGYGRIPGTFIPWSTILLVVPRCGGVVCSPPHAIRSLDLCHRCQRRSREVQWYSGSAHEVDAICHDWSDVRCCWSCVHAAICQRITGWRCGLRIEHHRRRALWRGVHRGWNRNNVGSYCCCALPGRDPIRPSTCRIYGELAADCQRRVAVDFSYRTKGN